MANSIVMTKRDYDRLNDLVLKSPRTLASEEKARQALKREIDRAVIVDSREIDPNVVTMNSVVRIKALDTGEVKDCALVYPTIADFGRGCISILVPLGMALLGYRKGDIVEWKLPGIIRKFMIKKIIYQPEAAGDYKS